MIKEKQRIIHEIIDGIYIYPKQIILNFNKRGLDSITGYNRLTMANLGITENYKLEIPIHMIKEPSQTIIILPDDPFDKILHNTPNKKLPYYITLAWKCKKMLETGKYKHLKEIAEHENLELSFFYKMYRFNYLAPDIIENIMDGDFKFINTTEFSRTLIPLLWEDQRKLFSVAEE